MRTVKFDDETGLPIIDETKNEKNHREQTRRKLQHHILIHEIHKRTIPQGLKFLLSQNKPSNENLSAIQIKTYQSIVDDQMMVCDHEQFKQHFDLIVEKILKILNQYLEKVDGKTGILVIGDSLNETGIDENEDNFIQIRMNEFIEMVIN